MSTKSQKIEYLVLDAFQKWLDSTLPFWRKEWIHAFPNKFTVKSTQTVLILLSSKLTKDQMVIVLYDGSDCGSLELCFALTLNLISMKKLHKEKM